MENIEVSENSAKFNFAEGEMLLIDKPLTWTSFDVVGKVRNSIKPLKLKVGHAGTLDPLATGRMRQATSCQTSPARPHNTDTATPDRYHTAPV
jgi:tRNA U55 pseudouridine synthase TruB